MSANLVVVKEFKIKDHVFERYSFFNVPDVVRENTLTSEDTLRLITDEKLLPFDDFVKEKMTWVLELCTFEADFLGLQKFKMSKLQKLTKLARQMRISAQRGKQKRFMNYIKEVETLVLEIRKEGIQINVH